MRSMRLTRSCREAKQCSQRGKPRLDEMLGGDITFTCCFEDHLRSGIGYRRHRCGRILPLMVLSRVCRYHFESHKLAPRRSAASLTLGAKRCGLRSRPTYLLPDLRCGLVDRVSGRGPRVVSKSGYPIDNTIDGLQGSGRRNPTRRWHRLSNSRRCLSRARVQPFAKLILAGRRPRPQNRLNSRDHDVIRLPSGGHYMQASGTRPIDH